MRHVGALRISLLVSLGIVPVACGGTFKENTGDDGTSGKGSSAGAAGKGVTTGTGGERDPDPVPGTSGSPGVAGKHNGGTGGTTISGAGGSAPVGGAGGAGPTCTSPMLDPKTGLIKCDEGYQHRPTAPACEVTGSVGSGGAAGGGGANGDNDAAAPQELPRADGLIACGADPSVCDAFELGYCGTYGQLEGCLSGCRDDADCGEGSICICYEGGSPHGGTCVSSNCETNADCGQGLLCATFNNGCGSGFACQTTADECRQDADCRSPGQGDGYCGRDYAENKRVCQNAVCGRPFLVQTAARVAPVVSSDAWSALDSALPRVDHLTQAERRALAEHWTRLGQLEHASIAAFARFSLQLLSLGAPPALVEACTRALADETAHTKLCFRLASAYAGRAIGPGPLDVAGSLEASSLGDIVDLVIIEGCFGETSATLEALEAADSASDPVIAAAYRQIARDEQRHAELAFHFVRWALERDRQGTSERIAAAIASPPSQEHGVANVAVPCLEALLALPQTTKPASSAPGLRLQA
jgi:hypothetical protein